MNRNAWLGALTLMLTCASASLSSAQSVCIPLPRLLTTMPMGGAVGSQVEITVTGEHLDDIVELTFTHPGLKAVRKLDANAQAEKDKFVVTIAADCPKGIHEMRAMTRLGISSARVFSVDTLREVIAVAPLTSLATAMELQVNSICNSAMTSKAIDHYRFQSKKGERTFIHCAARGIDSKLNAVLIVADAAGRDLLVERRSGTLDFTAPEDGQYVIKVHDLTFNGGPAYFYRLALQSLPADAALPATASTQLVSAFSWPPVGLPEKAAANETEPNNQVIQSQKISLPCDIAGSFFPAADVDRFEFTATKGDVWWVEVASERLGLATDPTVLVQRVTGDAAAPVLADVAEFTDIASPVKPSSNGYAYDGPPYEGGSSDLIGKLEIKEDGVYCLQLLDLFGGTRNDPHNVYRLIVRKATPDFAVVAWGLHMELRNGDRNALSKPIALRGGMTMALEVVAVRRDGFDGPIELTMEGLPPGVVAQGLTIAAGKTRGIMLLTAQEQAPPALANATFVGRAQIDGVTVTRPCRMAEPAWPIPDSWGEIPSPRLVGGVPVSVSAAELAPLSIHSQEKKVFEVAAGEKLAIALAHVRRGEFSGTTLQLKTLGEGFQQTPQFDVSIAGDASTATFDLAALKTPPGDYVIALYGAAVIKYQDNPGAVIVAKTNAEAADRVVVELAAEVQRLTAVASAATAEGQVAAAQALADVTAKHQLAVAAAKTAADQLAAATQRATPKDIADIVVSEPIAIRVTKPAGAP